MNYQEEKKHQQLIDGLHALARFLEEHPELGTPSTPTLYYFNIERERLSEVAHAFGSCEKYAGGDYFDLTKSFGPVKLQASWERAEVCERVVVGTETVEEEIPTAYEKRTVVREKVEWRCPQSVLRTDES